MFHLMFVIIILVRFGLLSGHLLGKYMPARLPYALIVFCLFVFFYLFPILVFERDLVFVCSSSC